LAASWSAGRAVELAEEHRACERWQRALWRAIWGPSGLAARLPRADGRRWLTLAELRARVSNVSLADGGPVHVFGFSHVAPLYAELLEWIARARPVFVYALNPCREFWEDARRSRGPGEGGEPRELPRALELWGAASRVGVARFNEMCGYDARDRFREDDSGHATQLGRLHREIVSGRPCGSAAPAGANLDDSIRFVAAPSPRREVEGIVAEIWRMLREDAHAPGVDRAAPLCLTDIAVLFPARSFERYLPHFAAFGAAHELPFSLGDIPLSYESPVVGAVLRLLALPQGAFTREEVLGFLSHPACALVRGVDAEEMTRLCERTGIVRAIDRTSLVGTYVERDLLSWDQGLRRLALGAMMAADPHAAPLALGDERYLPEPIAGDRVDAAASFALGARALFSDARRLPTLRVGPAAWGEHLCSFVETFIRAEPGPDERALERVLGALRSLEALDVGAGPISFRVASDLALEAVRALRATRGRHGSSGVVVGTLEGMRGVPFRALFLAGLGEGDLPSPERRDPLDLCAATSHPADASAREHERLAFLQALLCARERLVISYVARDETTGDARSPSSLAQELVEILAGDRAPEEREACWRRSPLWRDEDPDVCAAIPAAATERRARLGLGDVQVVAESALLGGATTREVSLSMAALRRFLECPLQGYASFRLRLAEEALEGGAAMTDEPFVLDRLEGLGAARAAFARAVRAAYASGGAWPSDALLSRSWCDVAAPLELRAQAPTGLLGAAESRTRIGHLRAWRDALAGEIPGERPRLAVFRLGPAAAGAEDADVTLPRVEIEAHGQRVQIGGATLPFALSNDGAAADGAVVLVARTPTARASDRDLLRVTVEAAVLAAAGVRVDSLRVCVANARGRGAQVISLAGVSAAEARAWLGSLLEDLLRPPHDYLLPCEAVFEQKKSGAPLRDIVESLRADPEARVSSRWGPIRDALAFEPPDEARARAMVERRFALFARMRGAC
jgi:exodeoxyribonuclease V gamma subunit